MEKSYKEILDELYSKYYKYFARYSEVTSSHWRHIGKQKVETRNGCWLAQGYGFGDFVSPNAWRRVKFLPTKILLYYIVKKFRCPSYLNEAGRLVANKSARLYDYDCVRQVLSLHEILKQLGVEIFEGKRYPLSSQGVKVACVIGDGYGYFSTLLQVIDPEIKVITVNLGRTLFFDVLNSQKCLPDKIPILLKEGNSRYELLAKHTLAFCEAENYHLLEGMPIDLYINIASMQEMDLPVICKYFDYITSSSSNPVYFYCCNRLEKILPDGAVTRFMEYPWKNSIVLLDELCPWYQRYPSSKPPFWMDFDGSIQHRFVKWDVSRDKEQ